MAEKMRIGYEDISKINPGIIYCSISAFGTSPARYADRAAVDMIVQSMGGIMSVTGMPDGPPVPAGLPIADLNGGIYGYAAIMTALYYKAITGIGQRVSVTLIDTMVFSLSTRFAELVGLNKVPQRLGNAHSQIVPFQTFKTADGWVTVAAITEEQWKKICKVLGAEELPKDPRYASPKLRLENRESLTAKLNYYFQKKPAKEWLDIFVEADVMCGPLWNIKDLISSDLVSDHGFVTTVNHPIEGTYPVLQTPFNFSKTPGEVQGPAPLLGENSQEILSAIGYDENNIKNLVDNNVIKVANYKKK
jgi:crotonobetainyl-CoA:carnitine CoA-transferase CaiB-like acyl-CoA transferase